MPVAFGPPGQALPVATRPVRHEEDIGIRGVAHRRVRSLQSKADLRAAHGRIELSREPLGPRQVGLAAGEQALRERLGRGAEGDQRDAVLGFQLVQDPVERLAGLLDGVARHGARAVDHDRQVQRPGLPQPREKRLEACQCRKALAVPVGEGETAFCLGRL